MKGRESMRLHPRERIVTEARLDLRKRILDWREQHADLTDGELLGILGGTLGDEVTGLAKYMVRAERHPDEPDRPGGLE
jgi:hypothetical protein